MSETQKYERPPLSDKSLPDPTKRYGETDFNLEAILIMLDNEEYQYLINEENGGIKVETSEQKQVKTAENIYDIRNYIRDHMEEIKQDPELQKSIVKKIETLKKFSTSETEFALITTLENMLNYIKGTE